MSSFVKFFSGAYSFGTSERSSFKQQNLNDSPGPGAYDPKSHLGQKSLPNYKFPTSKRPIVNNQKIDEYGSSVPPVGQYNPQENAKGPYYSFGQLIKDKKPDNNIGPCTYNIKPKNQKQQPSYSFGYKSEKFLLNESQDQEVPGPGTYYSINNKNQEQNQFNNKLNISERISQVNKQEQQQRIKKIIAKMKESPGPGDYFPKNAVQSLSYSQKFGISDRDAIPKDINLGPGIYNPEYSFASTAKGFSLLGRIPEKSNTSIMNNPGPGAYNPKQISTQQTCQFMSTRRQIIPDSIAYPGPGAYNINQKQQNIKKRSTFGKSVRNSLLTPNQNTPGVGNYELRLKFNGPTIPFIGKKDHLALPDSVQFPGPGKYFENNNQNNPSIKYGFGLKLNQDIKETPGPGQYSINRNLEGLGYSFGQKHFDPQLKNNQPGPGSYEISSTIAAIPNYLNTSKISFMNLSKTIGDESLELQNQILGN